MDRNSEIGEKIERVVRVLAAENLGGVLIGAQHNFAWLTGGGTNGIDLSREGERVRSLCGATGGDLCSPTKLRCRVCSRKN